MWLVAPVLDSVSLANDETTEIFLNNQFFKNEVAWKILRGGIVSC